MGKQLQLLWQNFQNR